MSITDIYQQHRIPRESRCIRVLDILPATRQPSGSNDDPMKCALRIINLDDRPRFTALSYVWGTDPPSHEHFLQCEDVRLPVTENCLSALQHLRRKLGHFTIWVDAVCMNQSDLAEKAQQIPLMGDIYSLAKVVYVWLGEGTPETDRAMQYLATDHLQPFFEKNSPLAAAWFIKSSAYSWRRNPLPFPDNMKPWNRYAAHTNCSDLDEVFSRPWIGRVWTYQEILLASQPVLVCGDFHVSWPSVERHIQYLIMAGISEEANIQPWMSVVLARADLQSTSSSKANTKTYHIFLERLHRWMQIFIVLEFATLGGFILGPGIVAIRSYQDQVPALNALYAILVLVTAIFIRYSWSGKTIQTFRFNNQFTPTETGVCSATYKTNELINALYTRRSRDPKDMAFGMLAVLRKRGVPGLKPPDYTQNVGDVYRDFTIYLCSLTHSMEALLFAAARNYPDQPSWIPAWASCRQQTWGQNVGEIQATDDWGVAVSRCGVNHETAQPIVDKTRSIMSVQAYEVATISTFFKAQQTSRRLHIDVQKARLENAGILLWPTANTLDILSIDARNKQSRPLGTFRRYILRVSRLLLWKFMLYRCRNKTRSEIFGMLQGLKKTYGPLRRIYEIYTQTCDYMADYERAIFMARYTALPKELCHGEASNDVEVGDKILRVEGLPQLLLVRACGSDQNAVRIISPVVLKGSSVEDQRPRKRIKIEYEPRYTEYKIH